MAIKLIGNYAKRLGLPGYSSHQFSVSVETELTDTGDIQGEATEEGAFPVPGHRARAAPQVRMGRVGEFKRFTLEGRFACRC